jgi:hypothetical protein
MPAKWSQTAPRLFSADLAEATLGNARCRQAKRAYERDDPYEPRVPLMRTRAGYRAGTTAEVPL